MSELKKYLEFKDKGMPRGKINQIAWLLLNGAGCDFCETCRDEPCTAEESGSCTKDIANYIGKCVKEEENE